MSRSEAMAKASKKYEAEKLDKLLFRMPKGKKALIQAHVQKTGESVNAFINRAVDEAIENDGKK